MPNLQCLIYIPPNRIECEHLRSTTIKERYDFLVIALRDFAAQKTVAQRHKASSAGLRLGDEASIAGLCLAHCWKVVPGRYFVVRKKTGGTPLWFCQSRSIGGVEARNFRRARGDADPA